MKTKSLKPKRVRTVPLWSPLEGDLRDKGFKQIAGVDEAGRGPLAGPVVAAAVILPDNFDTGNLNDSKKLTASQRDQLFDLITDSEAVYGIGIVDNQTIDHINILRATQQAMAMAVTELKLSPDHVLVDGNQMVPELAFQQTTVIGGDSICRSIAAASILAKVTRDRIMEEYARKYVQFSFDRHKGYPTRLHIKELGKHGPTPIHRRSYRPVQEAVSRLSIRPSR